MAFFVGFVLIMFIWDVEYGYNTPTTQHQHNRCTKHILIGYGGYKRVGGV